MDEFKQVGPEKPGYDEDIDKIIGELTHGARCVAVSFAARMTQKHIVLAVQSGIARIGSEPPGLPGASGLFVGIDGGRAAWLPTRGVPMHWSYIARHLEQPFGDSEVDHPLADFVNVIADGVAYYAGVTA